MERYRSDLLAPRLHTEWRQLPAMAPIRNGGQVCIWEEISVWEESTSPSDVWCSRGIASSHSKWLAKKAGVLGCTSSSTILFMCWKEIFPNEDATRFDLVDELCALPAKMPTSMFQFAAWLEDWMTKLVVADEVSAHIEPRRAMAVPDCGQYVHDRVGGYLSRKWTSRRCHGEEPPGCMFEVGCFGQSRELEVDQQVGQV